MNDENERRYEVAELADRVRAKYLRGDEPGLEDEIDFASLTDAERDDFMALLDQRASHSEERLGGLAENVRILRALLDLVERSGAPPGATLGEALVAGYVSALEVVEAVRAVPDPLADRK